MARNDVDLDLDVETAKKGGGGKMKFIVIALVLIGASVATTYFLIAPKSENTTPAVDAAATEADAEAGDDPKTIIPDSPPQYLSLDPAFVVNLDDDESDVRYLQVSVTVMSYSAEKIEKIQLHMPVIRHHLVLLFGSQKYSDIRSRAGKEMLQKKALEVVKKALTQVAGEPLVDNLFLPSIVGQ